MPSSAVVLMCPPKHFAVTYTINPWMEPATWAREKSALAAVSRQEWEQLRQALCDLGATVETIAARAGVPDLVFTANAAVVLDGKALLARFRHTERRREEPHVARAFAALCAQGLVDTVHTLPLDLVLEGAGDCVWDRSRSLFWMGYGQRSDEAAQHAVAQTFGTEVLALRLADLRFYHLDTALCPLADGDVMYFPGAFTAAGVADIRARVAPSRRIEIGEDDACRLSANAVCLGETLVLSGCGEDLRTALTRRGYRVVTTPLTSFLRSGGSAFCLTLRLDQRSPVTPAQARELTALAG